MFKGTIYRRVIATIKERIALAEKDFEDGVEKLREDVSVAVSELHTKLEADEKALADKLVADILGK